MLVLFLLPIARLSGNCNFRAIISLITFQFINQLGFIQYLQIGRNVLLLAVFSLYLVQVVILYIINYAHFKEVGLFFSPHKYHPSCLLDIVILTPMYTVQYTVMYWIIYCILHCKWSCILYCTVVEVAGKLALSLSKTNLFLM